MSKIVHLGGFLGRPFKPLAKSVLIPLGLTAVVAATDAAIQKKVFRSGINLFDLSKRTTLIISNEEMDDVMKIVKSLKESGLLIKVVSKTVKNKTKEQKCGFHGMLLGT